MMRKIFGTKAKEVSGEWKRLPNEELYDLYSSPNIIRVNKSRIMLWPRHVTYIGVEEMHR